MSRRKRLFVEPTVPQTPRNIVLPGVKKGGHWKKRALDALVPDPQLHTEICNKIIHEMRVISREEWFAIGKKGKPGAIGFSPMRQLQSKIRDQPLTFPPELTGIFRVAGNIVQRVIDWPSPGWPVRVRQSVSTGWGFGGGNLHPYRLIDPVLDELDWRMEEYGEADPRTHETARRLVHLCLVELHQGKVSA